MLLFEEIDKNIQFNSLFLGIRETCFCPRETDGVFFTRELKKVVRLKQCPLYILTALEMRKREVYRKQAISQVSVILNKASAVEHDRFMQASLCTVSLLFANTLPQVINPIISVAGLNTYQFVSLFQ